MRPILSRSEITGSVYITTKYKALGNGEFDTFEKYDVTREFDAIANHIVEENAALRELVAGYAVVAGNLCTDGFVCAPETECRYYHQSKGRQQCMLGELNGRAKEFGIEVE